MPVSPDENALRLVVEGTVSETGTEFFRALVKNLAAAMGTAGMMSAISAKARTASRERMHSR